MEKIFWILKVILMLPIIPIIGVPDAGDAGDSNQDPPPAGDDTDGDDDGTDGDDGGNGDEDKPMTMTRAEFDAAVKKEARKLARKSKKGKNGGSASDDGSYDGDDTVAKAEKALAAANKKMVEGTVKGLASEMDITAKGAKAALRIVDFSECFDADGELDEDAVKDALEDFLDEWPEFKKADDNNPGGTGGKGNFARRRDKKPEPKTFNEKVENKLSALFK